jgi:hypothetical protein
MTTIESTTIGLIRACGPVTFEELVHEARTQATEPAADSRYNSMIAVSRAINKLAKAGEIELYDTGDAWVEA